MIYKKRQKAYNVLGKSRPKGRRTFTVC